MPAFSFSVSGTGGGGVGTFTNILLTQGTITANTPVIDATTTWNNAGVAFTGIRYNVTDTASAAGSFLMDLQVGGSSLFRVSKGGSIGIGSGAFLSIVPAAGGNLDIQCNNTSTVRFLIGKLVNRSDGVISWSSTLLPSGTPDLIIQRDAANVFAQRNAANAQTFRIYNTFTDASNYERGFAGWTTNEFRIGTEKLGTGVARPLVLQTDGTTRLTIEATGTGIYAGVFRVAAGNYFDVGGRSHIRSPATGNIQLTSNTGTDFGLLQFGLTNNTRPALKPSSTTLQVRLADDSAFTTVECNQVRTNNGTFLVSGVALTDGAAAAIGTLTNAPVAGDPTKWIPINDNGTTRYIPAW